MMPLEKTPTSLEAKEAAEKIRMWIQTEEGQQKLAEARKKSQAEAAKFYSARHVPPEALYTPCNI